MSPEVAVLVGAAIGGGAAVVVQIIAAIVAARQQSAAFRRDLLRARIERVEAAYSRVLEVIGYEQRHIPMDAVDRSALLAPVEIFGTDEIRDLVNRYHYGTTTNRGALDRRALANMMREHVVGMDRYLRKS